MFLPSDQKILPLENGDHLNRVEFERRYAAMPHLKKAELIEGVVHLSSAVRFASHAEPHALLITWLGVYRAATPGVRLGDNATVRLDGDNEPQPDALLRLDPAVGGRSRLSGDGYVEGAPELVVEIAASSASYERNLKLCAYRSNGVQEYLLWLVEEQRLEWFYLEQGEYALLSPDEQGTLCSRIFPGLCLAVSALLAGDLAQVLGTVQQRLDTPEYRAFSNRMRSEL
nr:Uma2 family endonuclease [Gloeobacter violaceus]